MTFTTLSQARAVAGSLSRPSKMPGYGYGIPATRCIRGSVLRTIEGSTCSTCYALKGRYGFGVVKDAMEFRFEALTHPDWVDAMVHLISATKVPWFRWHDSGDLQGLWHLDNIVTIANRLPEFNFWLPTREEGIIREYRMTRGEFPSNLTVRVSAAMINGKAPSGFANTSTVVVGPEAVATCPAPKQGGICGDCRACWSKEVVNVAYKAH